MGRDAIPAAKSKSKTRTTRTGKQNKRMNGMVLNAGGGMIA